MSPHRSGFTLLEILVVLVIIGIVLSLAVVRLEPSPQQALQQESERLALVLEAARDEAIARGEPIAWSHQGARYQFWRRQDDWLPLPDVDTLKARELPSGVAFGEIQVNLQRQGEDGKLVFQPSGVNELFRISLVGPQSRLELVSDVLGRVSLSQNDVPSQN